MSGASEIEIARWSRELRSAPVLWCGGVLLLLLAAGLWLHGAGFYSLPLSQRVDHHDFHVLSPGRTLGRSYGMVGFSLMVLNLSYLLRRHFPRLPLGRMHVWLDAHVVTGFTAALFVAFHSAFQLRSPVAKVIAATLSVTVATGVVGRFFHAFVPRVQSRLPEKLLDLEALVPGSQAKLVAGLMRLAISAPLGGSGLLRVVRRLPRWLSEARARRSFVMATFDEQVQYASALDRRMVEPLAEEIARLASSEVLGVAGRELLRAWRPWHRLCALIMVAGVALHVTVAVFFGYAWDARPWP